MKLSVDLRFAVAPLLHVLLQYYHHPFLLGLDDHPPKLKMAISLVLGFLFFLFLALISVKLPFTFTLRAEPVYLRAGDFYFSGPIAVTLLASFLFPESLFWYVYLICVGISPFSGLLLKNLNRFLRAIPSFIIVCAPATGQQAAIHEPEQPPPQSGGILLLDLNQYPSLNEPLYPENEDMDDNNMGFEIIYGHS